MFHSTTLKKVSNIFEYNYNTPDLKNKQAINIVFPVLLNMQNVFWL